MIQYVSVSKHYKDFTALDDVTLGIDEGEFVMLTGHSGSGKTTLIKMLIREINPSTGEITVDGDEITRLRRWKIANLRRKIGVVFQDFKLLDDKNIYENVAFALEASGKSDKDIREIVPYVLEIVGLQDKMRSFPKELSGGQKQKAAIARAIANDPKILIADEPTGNLDQDASWEIVEILKNINNWGTTVMMVTHGMDIVESLDHRRLILENGKLISDSKEPIENKEFTDKIILDAEAEKEIEVDVELEVDDTAEDIVKEQEENAVKEDQTEIAKKEKKETKKKTSSTKKKTKSETKKTKTEVKIKPKKKIKIGLSSKKTKKKPTAKKENREEEEIDEKEKKDEKSTDFKDYKLSKATLKLLDTNGYKNLVDVASAGMSKIKMLDKIKGNQILEIEEMLENFEK